MESHHQKLTEWQEGVNRKLNSIFILLLDARKRSIKMSIEMDALTVAVEDNTKLDGSIIDLLNGIAAQITDTAGDKAAAIKLAAELNEKSAALAAAIQANTPATPAE